MHGRTSPIAHDGRTHLRGSAQSLRGHAIPFADRRAGVAARVPRGQRMDGRGRNHGPAPCNAGDRRRSVSPREHSHARRQSRCSPTGSDVSRDHLPRCHWSCALSARPRCRESSPMRSRPSSRASGRPSKSGRSRSAVRARGETAEAIAAAARAHRGAHDRRGPWAPLVADTCGTGGDGSHTFNVSTAAAIVVAACGVPVAKHGNRSISSRCGSADVVEALGIPIDQGPNTSERGAPRFASRVSLSSLRPPTTLPSSMQRKRVASSASRTLFNALGPIANPARATHQVIGVYDDSLRPLLAQCARRARMRAGVGGPQRRRARRAEPRRADPRVRSTSR